MPFASDKQRKFMFANHPKLAHKMAHDKGRRRGKSKRGGRHK